MNTPISDKHNMSSLSVGKGYPASYLFDIANLITDNNLIESDYRTSSAQIIEKTINQQIKDNSNKKQIIDLLNSMNNCAPKLTNQFNELKNLLNIK